MKRHYTFRTEVDSDIKKYSPAEFHFLVTTYLNDPDGWNSKGYTFEAVDSNEDVLIRLSSPKTLVEKCGLSNNLSCAELGGRHMYLNSYRWFHGSKKSKFGQKQFEKGKIVTRKICTGTHFENKFAKIIIQHFEV